MRSSCDHHIARLHRAQRCRARDARIDIDVLEVPAVLQAAGLDLALLLVEADA
jgi:hypothetical protein